MKMIKLFQLQSVAHFFVCFFQNPFLNDWKALLKFFDSGFDLSLFMSSHFVFPEPVFVVDVARLYLLD